MTDTLIEILKRIQAAEEGLLNLQALAKHLSDTNQVLNVSIAIHTEDTMPKPFSIFIPLSTDEKESILAGGAFDLQKVMEEKMNQSRSFCQPLGQPTKPIGFAQEKMPPELALMMASVMKKYYQRCLTGAKRDLVIYMSSNSEKLNKYLTV